MGYAKERTEKDFSDSFSKDLIIDDEVQWMGYSYSLPTLSSLPSSSERRSNYTLRGELNVTKYTDREWKIMQENRKNGDGTAKNAGTCKAA